MKRISIRFLLLLCLFHEVSWSQSKNIKGQVYATADVEGVHVINKTSGRATVTDAQGTFNIQAKKQDTLVFSGVLFKLESIRVDEDMMRMEILKVFLVENVNQLGEVVVGRVLTGDLISDIENSGAKPPINFYDVGIPGYKGKKMTQSERRLAEAGEFKASQLLGVFVGSVPLNPIINAITGRTKMLKQRVKLEAQDEVMYAIKAQFSQDLFTQNPLEESLHLDFFYFCSEDPEFMTKCQDVNGLTTMAFLQEKLTAYKKQRDEPRN